MIVGGGDKGDKGPGPFPVTISNPSFGSAVLLVKRVTWADTAGQIGVRNDAAVEGGSPGKADAEYVMATAIVGWSDVFDSEGAAVPFSRDALAEACTAHPLFGWCAWRVADNAFSGITEDVVGNLPAPSDNGSGTAEATTPESTDGSDIEPNG